MAPKMPPANESDEQQAETEQTDGLRFRSGENLPANFAAGELNGVKVDI